MINLTAARLIWLLYTSDWVEEGAGSGLDLVWWVGSIWNCTLGAAAPTADARPFPGCPPAALCHCPLVTVPCSLTSHISRTVNLRALTLCKCLILRVAFILKKFTRVPQHVVPPPVFLLDTFW